MTNADRNAEMLMREAIKSRYPDHGIIGEEFGRSAIMPMWFGYSIRLTARSRLFMACRFYTTLIGILINDKPEVGVIYAPALNEMVSAATGLGCTSEQGESYCSAV